MELVAGGREIGGACGHPCTQQVHAHGAGANACRVYVRGMRGLTFTSSSGTAGSTPTSQPNTCWCVHPFQNLAGNAFFAPGSRVLSRVLGRWTTPRAEMHIQFRLTLRVTHKVLHPHLPLEGKQARAQRNLSSKKPRQTERPDHPSITVRQTKWSKNTSGRSQNEGHKESQPKFKPYFKSLFCYCGCSGLRCLTRLRA